MLLYLPRRCNALVGKETGGIRDRSVRADSLTALSFRYRVTIPFEERTALIASNYADENNFIGIARCTISELRETGEAFMPFAETRHDDLYTKLGNLEVRRWGAMELGRILDTLRRYQTFI